MTFLDKLKTNYKAPEAKPESWKQKFNKVFEWANSNPWDEDVVKPTDTEIKKCIFELYEAAELSSAGFKFLYEKTGHPAAEACKDILEGR